MHNLNLVLYKAVNVGKIYATSEFKMYCVGMGVRRNFSRGGKDDILLMLLWLLMMQRKLTYTKKKMSIVTATVAYSAFLVRKLYIEQMFVLVSMDILRLS